MSDFGADQSFPEILRSKWKYLLFLLFILVFEVGMAKFLCRSPLLSLAVPILLVFIVLSFFRLDLGLLLLLIYAPFHQAYIDFFPSTLITSWKEGALILILVIWLSKIVLRREQLPLKTPLIIPTFAFLMVALVQFVNSPSLVKGIFGLKSAAAFIPAYFIAANLQLTKREVKRLVLIMIVVVSLSAIYELFKFFAPLSWFPTGLRIPRHVAGIYRIHFSSAVPCSVFMLFLTIGFFTSSSSKGVRFFSIIAACVMFTVLMYSLVRLWWILIGIGLIFMSISRKEQKLLYLIPLGILVVFFIFPPFVWQRAVSITDFYDPSLQSRIQQASRSLAYASKHPLGVGMGAISSDKYRHLAKFVGSSTVSSLFSTENGFLTILVEMGVVGLGVYIWFMFSVFKQGFRIFHSLTDNFLRWLALGILSSCFVFFLSHFFNESLLFYPMNFYFWFLLGLLMALKQTELKENSFRENTTDKR